MIYQLSGLITEYDHCCLFNVLLSRKIKRYQKGANVCIYYLRTRNVRPFDRITRYVYEN